MIKVIELVKKRPDLSIEEFRTYWKGTHGAIVSAIPGLRRYVQSHPLMGGYRNGSLPFDGVAEVWFDDKDAMRTMATTPEFAAAKADEPNFIDPSELIELVVDEAVIKDNPAPDGALKIMELVNIRTDRDPAEMHRHWEEVHGPIAAKIPTVTRYVQSHVRPGAYRGGARPAFDGIASVWFESIEVARSGSESPEIAATRADEANFLGVEPQRLLTEEIVFVG